MWRTPTLQHYFPPGFPPPRNKLIKQNPILMKYLVIKMKTRPTYKTRNASSESINITPCEIKRHEKIEYYNTL